MARAVLRRTEDRAEWSIAERAIGLALREMHDFPGAARHLRRSIKIAADASLPRLSALAQMSLAWVLVYTGKHKQALKALDDAMPELAGADEFWGIDSALLHYARFLRTPCLSFWGPTHPETRLKPIDGLAERVVYRKVPCSPCIHLAEEPPCGGNNVCIRNLFESAPGQELEWCSRVEARAR